MPGSISRAQWKRYLTQGLLVFGVLFAAYCYRFVYVEGRTAKLEAESLELLLESSEYLADELRELHVNVENAVAFYAGSSTELEKLRGLAGNLDQIEGLRPNLLLTDSVGTDVRTLLDASGDRPRIVFQANTVPGTGSWNTSREPFVDIAYADLDSILADVRPPEEWFETVLLARLDGTVLVSDGRGPIVIRRMPSSAGGPESGKSGNVDGELAFTTVSTVPFTDTDYRIFRQPITLPRPLCVLTVITESVPDVCADVHFVLVGTRSENAFRSQAMMLPPTFLFGLIGVLTCLLLALPTLKIRYLGRREQLDSKDVFVTSVSIVMLSSIATLAVFDAIFFEQLKQLHYRRLTVLANEMSDNFTSEVAEANEALHALTLSLRGTDEEEAPPTTPVQQEKIKQSLEFVVRTPAIIAWINKDGQQIYKSAVLRRPTPVINVADRPYFAAAKLRRELPDSASQLDWSDPRQWILQSIRSRNTGRVYATISQRIRPLPIPRQAASSTADKDTTAIVAAMTFRLRSVIGPVLPPGYGFSLVDRDGSVLFHSDDRRNLRENLFEKVVGGERLRAAVWSKDDQYRTISTYRDGTYQFVVRSAGATPWSLILFADLDRLRAVHAQFLTYAVALYLLFQVIMLALFGAYVRVQKDRDGPIGMKRFMRSMWPDERNRAAYVAMIGLEISLIFTWFAVELTLRPFVGAVVAMVLAMLALYNFCKRSDDGSGRSSAVAESVLNGDDGAEPRNNDRGRPDERRPIDGTPAKSARAYIQMVVGRYGVFRCSVVVVALLIGATVFLKRGEFQEWMIAIGLCFGVMAVWTSHFLSDWLRRWKWRRCYHVSYFLLVVLLGVLPPISFYRLLHDESMILFTRKEQVELLQQLQERAERLEQETDGASSEALRAAYYPSSVWEGASKHPRDVYTVGSELRISEQIEPMADTTAAENADLYLTVATAILATDRLEIMAHRGLRKLRRLVDAITPWSYEINSLQGGTKASAPWTWDEKISRGAVMLRARSYRRAAKFELTSESPAYRDLQIISTSLRLRDLIKSPSGYSFLLMLVGVLALFVLWTAVRDTICRIFFVDSSLNLPKGSAQLGEAQFYERLKTKASGHLGECSDRMLRCLARECRHDATLREIGTMIAANPELLNTDIELLPEYVLDQAATHYRRLWSQCSVEEKSTLLKISGGGFGGWRGRSMVRRLLGKGLLTVDAGLDVMNESFRGFLQEMNPEPEVVSWEKEAKASVWSRLRVPAIVSMIGVIAFLLYTQPGATDRTLGLIAALAAAIPALGKLLSPASAPPAASSAR